MAKSSKKVARSLYDTLTMTLVGTAPLIMHNARLADPLDPLTIELKKLTGKHSSKRTERDIAHIDWLRYYGSLYLDENEQPCMPSHNILGMMHEAGRKFRRGPDVLAATWADQHYFKLLYKGTRKPEAMYKNQNCKHRAGQKGKAGIVFQNYPRFMPWEVTFTVCVNTDIIDKKSLIDYVENIGVVQGLGALRPRFGKFSIKSVA